MKRIINLILPIMISIFTITLISLSIYKLLSMPYFLKKTMNYTDYYIDAALSIEKDINETIYEDSLKNVVNVIITKARVKADIELLFINEKEVEIRIKEDFKKEFEKRFKNIEYDETALNILVDRIGNTYKKGLFPYSEYKKINNKISSKINVKSLIIVNVILLLSYIIISFLINSFKIILIRSNYLISFSLIFLYILSKCVNLFDSFYYSNLYFSNYVLLIFNIIRDILLLISVVLLIINLSLALIDKYKKSIDVSLK